MLTTNDAGNYPQLNVLKKYLDGIDGFIAGGVFKNLFNKEPIKDIDIFFESEHSFKHAVDIFDDLYTKVYTNTKAVCYKFPCGTNVELIGGSGIPLPHDSVENTISKFDFSITKIALSKVVTESEKVDIFDKLEEEESVEWVFTHHEAFFEHLFFKRLVIDDVLIRPFSTFERVLKYTKYGYGICRESKVALLEAINSAENLNEAEMSLSLYDGVD